MTRPYFLRRVEMDIYLWIVMLTVFVLVLSFVASVVIGALFCGVQYTITDRNEAEMEDYNAPEFAKSQAIQDQLQEEADALLGLSQEKNMTTKRDDNLPIKPLAEICKHGTSLAHADCAQCEREELNRQQFGGRVFINKHNNSFAAQYDSPTPGQAWGGAANPPLPTPQNPYAQEYGGLTNAPQLLRPEKALDKQEGGDHYKQMAIQPIEYIHANKLDYLAGNVVKYISRHRNKNGAEDVRKALHYCQLILELEYNPEKTK